MFDTSLRVSVLVDAISEVDVRRETGDLPHSVNDWGIVVIQIPVVGC